jgi:hypothetical protein
LAQTYDAERFEIIVVNNDSSARAASTTWFQSDRVKIITEDRPGSYNARNCGAAAAKGAVLAFTDSDCEPERDWLEKLTDCMQKNRADLVTGSIRMIAEDTDRLSAVEAFDLATGLPQETLAKKKCGVTANMAVSRRMFGRVGGFDGSGFSGEDIEFCLNVGAAGAHFKYCESATVLHPVRSQWREIMNKARRVAGAKGAKGNRDIIRTIPRIAAAQFDAVHLIWSTQRLSSRQKISASAVLCVIKLVQGWEFIKVYLFRGKRLR